MEWRYIKSAPFYMISSEGHVKSLHRFVKCENNGTFYYKEIQEVYPLREKDVRGYKNVSIISYDQNMKPIRRWTAQVHRLVLEAFNPVENMGKLQVNHINFDKSDNSLDNLEWVTPKQNTIHAHLNGHKRNQDGELNSCHKLTNEDVVCIMKEFRLKNRRSDQEIADEYGVTIKTISHIRRGFTWKHIPR